MLKYIFVDIKLNLQFRSDKSTNYFFDNINPLFLWVNLIIFDLNNSTRRVMKVRRKKVEKICLAHPAVNFINNLHSHFSYESAFLPKTFAKAKMQIEKSSAKDICTYNEHVKRWWNWHQLVFPVQRKKKDLRPLTFSQVFFQVLLLFNIFIIFLKFPFWHSSKLFNKLASNITTSLLHIIESVYDPWVKSREEWIYISIISQVIWVSCRQRPILWVIGAKLSGSIWHKGNRIFSFECNRWFRKTH